MTRAVGGSYQVEQQSQTLLARSLGDLLNETFAIFGRHCWRLIGLAALVQAPITVLAYSMGDGRVAYGTEGILRILGSTLVYGAIVVAVTQHYVSRAVGIRECYGRAWRRIVSLTLISLILAFPIVLILELSLLLGAALALLIVPALILLVYWSISAQAVLVEGCKPLAALKRSFDLVRGSWWRVFGIGVVAMLVVVGLGLVLGTPFALVSGIVSPAEATRLGDTFQFLGTLIVSVSVPIVAPIVLTLLYFDLRVRKEGYNFPKLRQEMGIQTA